LRSSLAVILAFFADSEMLTSTFSTTAAPSAGSGVAELGLTVMIGVPLVTCALTVKLPANTDCVVCGPPSPATTSTASVISPDPVLTASRPATSLPSA
jgi:hypothetical protein